MQELYFLNTCNINRGFTGVAIEKAQILSAFKHNIILIAIYEVHNNVLYTI